MSDPDAAWNKTPVPRDGHWRRFTASLPMRASLIAVAVVWLLGCVWSYQEQSAFAASKGFAFPHLLPLVIDGFAVSMAGVSWAASLDARPAIPARLATVVAVGASSASNGVWAYLRTNHDMVTVVLGVTVPIAANLAFEVLLAELRRQVQRRRGLPPPVAVPYPRLIRLLLAPFQTFRAWRALVLEITALDKSIHRPIPATAERVDQPAAEAARTMAQLPAPNAAAIASDAAGAAHGAPRPAPAPPASPPDHVPHGHPALSGPAQPAPAWLNGHSVAEPVQPAWARSLPLPEDQPRATQPPAAATGQLPPYQPPARPYGEPAQTHREPAQREPAARPTPAPSRPSPARPSATASSNGRTSAPATPTRPAPEPEPVSTGTRPEPAEVDQAGSGRGASRPVDPRVERLAQHLATAEDAEELTGERVAELLKIDVAPRTGRRLLGQARELLSQRAALADADADAEFSIIGGR
ncbi:MAG TPA: DUF2637 domain-containing protein [Pseudonocardia sp.]